MSMKDNRCFICKYKQNDTLSVKNDLIYGGKGHPLTLPLCYNHSVELFKNGQRSFLNKHKNIFTGNFGSEKDMDLIKHFNNNSKEDFRY